MEKLDGKSKDILKENIEKLKQIFPEIVTEGNIDFDKLKNTLGEYVDDREERYNFTWNGKAQVKRLAQTPSTGTLRPCKEESVNWDVTENLFFEGDNLEILKLIQKTYHKKIKMIYIDPPYNTGKDFIYKDNFKDNIKNYLELTGQTDSEGKKLSANTETRGRYHTDWLNMMYPRLKLARNLLTDDGVILMSIDDNEIKDLRSLGDEVFGESNFIGCICWNSTKSVTNTALISVSHNYKLVYAKDLDHFVLNRSNFRLPESGEGFDNPDKDPRGPWKADPFQVGGWRPNQQYEIKNPKTGIIYKPNPGSSWKNDDKKFQELLKDNRIIFGVSGEAGPQRKRFLSEALERGRVSKTWWDDVGTTTNGTQELKKLFDGKNIFDNPKPVTLLNKLILLGDYTKNGIILDFFAGSATTAHSIIELNVRDGAKRKFIMVQFPELCDEKSEAFKAGYKTIADIGKERIRRVIKQIEQEQGEDKKNGKETLFDEAKQDDKPLDLGFKVFKLDSSNIKAWDSDFDSLEKDLLDSVNNIKQDRSSEDVLYEILLKYGLDLTLPIEERKICNKTVYSIGLGALIVCLDKDISLDVVEEIAKLKEELNPEISRVVFSDTGFKDDVVKTNTVQILKQHGIEDVKSI